MKLQKYKGIQIGAKIELKRELWSCKSIKVNKLEQSKKKRGSYEAAKV